MTPAYDILVIGSGASGLTLALHAAGPAKVAVLSKGGLNAGATQWAQGGIAAVLADDDSIESHIEDTINAGAGLCDEAVVRTVVEKGRAAVQELIEAGVPFSREGPVEEGFGFHLTREGGHSHRRVIHVADSTGAAIEKSLSERAREHPDIAIFEDHIAVDLITARHVAGNAPGDRCYGAYVFDLKKRKVQRFAAKATVLATGGASKVYLYTTNPDGATGDGIALAWRAGCRVANMEFNQFHPTCLYHPEAKSFLITEAMRGEGGRLLLPTGEPFLAKYDPRAELAPRDIVARAIDHEMKRRGIDHVLLDVSHLPPDFVIGYFPMIYRRCMKFGFDLTKAPIPVVPAAHYTCGGVMADLHGRTDLANLFAIGECAHTGLHGANRMASNSLLECLVFGIEAAVRLREEVPGLDPPAEARPWDESRVTDSDEEVVVSHNWGELRRFMWDYVGIVRTDKRLARAANRVELLSREIHEYYGNFRVSRDLLELRNLVQVADLIVRSAALRKESRGLHFTADYPDVLPQAENTVLTPEAYTGGKD